MVLIKLLGPMGTIMSIVFESISNRSLISSLELTNVISCFGNWNFLRDSWTSLYRMRFVCDASGPPLSRSELPEMRDKAQLLNQMKLY